MKFPKARKRNYYRYLCGVADNMNEEFKYEGSKDRAVVIRDDKKLKIIILKQVEYNLYTIKDKDL